MKKFLVCLFSIILVLALFACGKGKVGTEIINPGFEAGVTDEWEGWTKEGTAFSVRGVTNATEAAGTVVGHVGSYWFYGVNGGTQKMTGALVSNKFKLTGTGKIAFKMGAGKDQEKVYVAFYVDGQDTPVAKVSNSDYNEPYCVDQLVRKIVDLSEYLNKTIYIKIVDEDKGEDHSYVNIDDFVICATAEDVAKYETERAEEVEKYAEPKFEEDPTSTTIQNPSFETGDLTGWKILSGTAFSNAGVVPADDKWWTDRILYAEGDYCFDGSKGGLVESDVGVVRSSKFTLGGDGYISFMIGAGATNCYIALNDGETGEELIKVTNTTFKDPDLPNTLRRVYMDASSYKGRVVYMTIVDANSSNGFAFITADDFRVSLTAQEVKDLQLYQYEKIANETYNDSYNSLLYLTKYYDTYDYLFPLPVLVITKEASPAAIAPSASVDLTAFIADAEITYGDESVTPEVLKVTLGETEFTSGFTTFNMETAGSYIVTYGATKGNKTISKTITILVSDATNLINGGFETGDMTGWTSTYEPNGNPVISATAFWNERIPYNQDGNYHFDGWSAQHAESDVFYFTSSTFTLSGSGWVSFMMGGNAAALRVKLADTNEVIGFFRNVKFLDANFPSVAQGGRWATMTRYFYDFSAYLGKDMYVEIIDDKESGWGVSFFDDINFYYATKPDTTGYDVVEGSLVNGEGEGEVHINYEIAINGCIINGNLETGDMTGWTSEYPFGKNPVSNADEYWGERLPFNKTGTYFYNGWDGQNAEADGYQIKSSNFVLYGSGYITFKLASNSGALKVYKADGTLIAYYKQSRFSDMNFPNLDAGGSWADMGTYVADLSNYIGEELYIVVEDEVISGPWAVLFFDDVQTYHEEAVSVEGKYDVVTLYSKDGDDNWTVAREYQIPWTVAVNLVAAE